jgi:hypothetical protein
MTKRKGDQLESSFLTRIATSGPGDPIAKAIVDELSPQERRAVLEKAVNDKRKIRDLPGVPRGDKGE